MAIRKITDLTTAARKGLTDFLEDEEGGTGKNAALSAGMLVGVTIAMQGLVTQTAAAAINCGYYQFCPLTDSCYTRWQGQHHAGCKLDGDICTSRGNC